MLRWIGTGLLVRGCLIARLDDVVRIVHDDALAAIPRLPGTFGFVFLDSWKPFLRTTLSHPSLLTPSCRPRTKPCLDLGSWELDSWELGVGILGVES